MHDSPALERELLRKGVGTRAEDEDRCADCGRVPLIGETVYRYERGELRCELCRPLSRREPTGSDRVHAAEGVVRVMRVRAPA